MNSKAIGFPCYSTDDCQVFRIFYSFCSKQFPFAKLICVTLFIYQSFLTLISCKNLRPSACGVQPYLVYKLFLGMPYSTTPLVSKIDFATAQYLLGLM